MWRKVLIGIGAFVIAVTVDFSDFEIFGQCSSPIGWDDWNSFTFVNAKPNAMILLDRSGSMKWCTDGNPNCPPGHQRIYIALQAIKEAMDADGDGVVEDSDEDSLKIRLGYSYFINSTNVVVPACTLGTPYSVIWGMMNNTSATGGTPLNEAIKRVTCYFRNVVKPRDPARECRKNFIITLTDGADNYSPLTGPDCTGSASRCAYTGVCADGSIGGRHLGVNTTNIANVRDTIPVFMIGFGAGFPNCLKNTLEWMAQKGGTDNPLKPNVGDTSRVKPRMSYDCMSNGVDPGDQGAAPLGGYAFLESGGQQLADALKTIFRLIAIGSYTFAPGSAPVSMTSGSYLYATQFKPKGGPIWEGGVQAYSYIGRDSLPVDANGKLLNSYKIWDAGESLRVTPGNTRTMWTWISGSLTSFTQMNITPANLCTTTVPAKNALVNFFRGENPDGPNGNNGWMNEVFHSGVVEIGKPDPVFFPDSGYSSFVNMWMNRSKRIYAGTNDGMVHCFDTTGRERWAFILPSQLCRLKIMRNQHIYSIDGGLVGKNVWIDLDNNGQKSPNEWRTVIVGGLRQGGKTYFALDVTDPSQNPRLLWEVTLPNSGWTWSTPAVGRINYKTDANTKVDEWVAFVGGGFDSLTCWTNTGMIGGCGRFIAAIRIKDGTQIMRYDLPANYTFGIPSQVFLLDRNGDYYVDFVYAGDAGGNMWKLEVDTTGTISYPTRLTNRIPDGVGYGPLYKAPVLATPRRIFFRPTAAVDKSGNLWVYFGTGDKNDPWNTASADRFYGIIDREDNVQINKDFTQLQNVTPPGSCPPWTSLRGWYYDLPSGLKVFSTPIVLADSTDVMVYKRFPPRNICSTGDSTILYRFNYTCGGLRRSEQIGFGIPAPYLGIGIGQTGKGREFKFTSQTWKQNTVVIPRPGKRVINWREVF